MWTITGRDLKERLRHGGGQPFTDFMNRLLHAHAFAIGIPDSAIHTSSHVNVADGGVDAQVENGTPTDPTGWFTLRTVWQFKAEDHQKSTPNELTKEVNKPEARRLIEHGYAYRYVICDCFPANRANDLTGKLNRIRQEINGEAPPAHVLSADNVADWANRYPMVTAAYAIQGSAGAFLNLEQWGEQMRRLTPQFVRIAEWDPAWNAVQAHVELARSSPAVVLTVTGEPGVGKTRLVHEALCGLPAMAGMVVYTMEEDVARELAYALCKDDSRRAIIVADECRAEAQERLTEILGAVSDRARVIAIDNSPERYSWQPPDHRLARITPDETLNILSTNFPGVMPRHREVYARKAQGFIRLAADMCKHDTEITARGNFDAVMSDVHAYLCKRMDDKKREVCAALSLVTRVGWNGDVADELRLLARFVELDDREIRKALDALHTDGFVQRTSRYAYVTPEIVAHTAFGMAWGKWFKHDPAQALVSFPATLLDRFRERIASGAPDETQRFVADFFRREAQEVRPADLTRRDVVLRLVRLVETSPEEYSAVLASLIRGATHQELAAISGEQEGRHWGPRREIVWLLEWLVAFKEHFALAEEMLLRLALAEAEPGISNNATGIWRQLFQIVISGTEVPFVNRLALLDARHASDDAEVVRLAWTALDHALHLSHTGRVKDEIRGGRIVPPSWQPTTYGELWEAQKILVNRLLHWSSGPHPRDLVKAAEIAIKHTPSLLAHRHLDMLRQLLRPGILNDRQRVELFDGIDLFLAHSAQQMDSTPEGREYVRAVEVWLDSLQPADFHGRVTTVIGVSPWAYNIAGPRGNESTKITDLGREFLNDRSALERELPWLLGPEAESAGLLGEELGKADKGLRLTALLVETAIQHENTLLLRGYLKGLDDTRRLRPKRLTQILDALAEADPRLAYDLFRFAETGEAIRRTLSLYESGRLSVRHLSALMFILPKPKLPASLAEEVIRRLVDAVGESREDATRVTFNFIHEQIRVAKAGVTVPVVPPTILHEIWRFMSFVSRDVPYDSRWDWQEILKTLLPIDAARVSRFAAEALIGEQIGVQDEAADVLKEAFSHDPEAAMDALGRAILDPGYGWRAMIAPLKDLFASIPLDVIVPWLETNGEDAAKCIARHLASPYQDDAEQLHIPPLTKFVLTRFESSDPVFDEFRAGRHALQLYMGDIAASKKAEGEQARAFLTHPLRRIREWAAFEIKNADNDWWYRDDEVD